MKPIAIYFRRVFSRPQDLLEDGWSWHYKRLSVDLNVALIDIRQLLEHVRELSAEQFSGWDIHNVRGRKGQAVPLAIGISFTRCA